MRIPVYVGSEKFVIMLAFGNNIENYVHIVKETDKYCKFKVVQNCKPWEHFSVWRFRITSSCVRNLKIVLLKLFCADGESCVSWCSVLCVKYGQVFYRKEF